MPNPRAYGGWSVASIALFQTKVLAYSSTRSKKREVRSAAYFNPTERLERLFFWLVFGLNLAEFYALQSWLPTILTNLGDPLNTIALATSLTTIGGIVAALVIGPAMDRLGPYRSLATVYFAGVVFVALLGLAVSAPPWVLLIAAFCAGFCISGGQKSVIALAAIFLPSANPLDRRGLGLGYRQIRRHRGPAPDRRAAGLPTQRGKFVLCRSDPDAAGWHSGHAAGRQIQDTVSVQVAASSMSTVGAIGGPQKCFPNLASFRQVDAESEIAFSKKDETFQESQGILSPLRLPVPPRPLMPQEIRYLARFVGEVEMG